MRKQSVFRLSGRAAAVSLFGKETEFLVKGGEVYGMRCAELFEGITADNLAEYPAVNALFKALGEYVIDLLDDRGDEFELGGFSYDEDTPVTELIKALSPVGLTFERSGLLSDEECPVAFSLKMSFSPFPTSLWRSPCTVIPPCMRESSAE